MEFKLDKDLCFLDLEATGLNVVRDRIMQIAIIKYFKDGRGPAELSMLIKSWDSHVNGSISSTWDFSERCCQ